MPTLRKYEFTESSWSDVQGFDCGDQRYEVEVARWLTGTADQDSALAAIRDPNRPARVWLYRLDDGSLVGFGALARTAWRWTGKKDPRVPVTILIWLGVDRTYHGQPPGPPEDRYAAQILDDLIVEATQVADQYPVLGLCVQKDNARAIRFYERAGFGGNLEPFVDRASGVEYRRMALVLDPDALLRLRDIDK